MSRVSFLVTTTKKSDPFLSGAVLFVTGSGTSDSSSCSRTTSKEYNARWHVRRSPKADNAWLSNGSPLPGPPSGITRLRPCLIRLGLRGQVLPAARLVTKCNFEFRCRGKQTEPLLAVGLCVSGASGICISAASDFLVAVSPKTCAQLLDPIFGPRLSRGGSNFPGGGSNFPRGGSNFPGAESNFSRGASDF